MSKRHRARIPERIRDAKRHLTSLDPGAVVSGVARRHDVAQSLLTCDPPFGIDW